MACKRCGKEIGQDEIHIFWGGEKRRVVIECALGKLVTCCDKPFSEDELHEMEIGGWAMWQTNGTI